MKQKKYAPIMKNHFIRCLVIILVFLVPVIIGCSDRSDEVLTARITRTSYGIPHIQADNLKSLAFGQGYAFAEDGLCILADQIVKVRSERAKYFGAGDSDANIISDLGYKVLNVYQTAENSFVDLPQNVQDIIVGYAAGYNKFLSDKGLDDLAPECQNAEWVKPIDKIDLLAYYLSLTMLASGEQFMDYMVDAAPPTSARTTKINLKKLPDFRNLGLGSNGWGIGKDLAQTGRGALLANPHFPATGPLRFYENHLTIPGLLNVNGVALYGVPMVLIGFNEHLAWTHTVSDSSHFTVYKLTLADQNPTSYEYDGRIRQMTSRDISIQVLQDDGSFETVSRTIYSSHYGVMVEYPGLLDWTDTTAYCLKDANENNLDFVSHWLAMGLADNLDEFQQAFQDYKGIPWVNTIYADDQGNAFYIDGTPVPHLSEQTLTEFEDALETDSVLSILFGQGIVMLDGSTSVNEWQGTIGPGLVPYENAPKLERSDYVANSNNSHWLTHPDEPLKGYSLLYGPERTIRSLRTRLGLNLIEDFAGADGLLSAEEIRNALFSNRCLLAELVNDDLVTRCQARGENGVILDSGDSVNISDACDALAGWDGRMNVDSTGAHVFREFGIRFTEDLFVNPFDPEDPVDTPNGLAASPETGEDPVLKIFAQGVEDIETAGIAFDTELGDIQFTLKNSEKIPYHGGIGSNGVFNMMDYSGPSSNRTLLPGMVAQNVINSATGLHSEGYLINYGTSFAFGLEFTENGPQAMGILSYSQSNDSRSSHFDDQTRLYSQGSFRAMLFTDEEIEANTLSQVTISTTTKE